MTLAARVVAAGFAASMVFGVLAGTPAADAQTPPTHSNILSIATETPTVAPDGDFVVRLRVAGAPQNAKLQVVVHDRVQFRSDFLSSITGRNLRSPISTQTVDAVPDFSGSVPITVSTRDPQSQAPPDPSRLVLREGVYPVSIALIDSTRTTLDSLTTYLVRVPTAPQGGPLGVALVLPVGGGISLQPDGTERVDPRLQDSVLHVASALNAHPDVAATLGIDPETLDAVDRTTHDQLAKATTGRDVPGAPYVDVDAAAWLKGGLTTELGRELDVGGAHLGTLAPVDTATYLGNGSLTPDVARFLAARGVHHFVVPDTSVSPLDGRKFNRTLLLPFHVQDVDGVDALAADAALSAHAGETGDPLLDANHLVADLAMLWFDDPPDSRVAVVDLRAAAVEPTFLDAVATAISPSATSIFVPETLSTAFTSVPLAGSGGEANGRGTPLVRSLTGVSTASVQSFTSKLRTANDDLDAYRSAVLLDNPRPNDIERRVLVAGAAGLSDHDRNAYLDSARDFIRTEFSKVQAPGRQTINFTARDGVVSLTLRNTTGYPMTVALVLQADKLQFPGHEDGTMPVTLTEDTTRVSLRVATRASGDSALDVSVATPDHSEVIARTRVTVRSTAFSGLGIILSVGAVLFLLGWWGRHIVVTRREQRRRMRHAVGHSPEHGALGPAEVAGNP